MKVCLLFVTDKKATKPTSDAPKTQRQNRQSLFKADRYLFTSADSYGEHAAAVYSLIRAAKLNGVVPEAWLRHVVSWSNNILLRTDTAEIPAT